MATTSPADEPAQARRRVRNVRITVSKETTLLLGPLNADGTVNYLAAANGMLGKGVTGENNAAIPLIQAIGPKMLAEETRDQLLQRLGIASLPQDGECYLSPRDYLTAQQPDANESDRENSPGELWDRPRRGPVSASADPDLAGWLKRNARPLSLAVEASKRPRFFIPFASSHRPPRMLDALRGFQSAYILAIARTLACRAMLEAGSGRFDSALADLQAARRLARLIAQSGLLIDQMFAGGADELALEGFASLAGAGKLDARQARQLLRALDAGPLPLGPGADAHQMEMLFGLDFVTAVARDGLDVAWWPAIVPEDNVRIPDVDLDMDEMLRLTQQGWQAFAAADALPTYAQRAEARRRLDRILDANVAAVVKEYPGLLAMRRRLRAVVEKLRAANRAERTRAVHEAMSKATIASAEGIGKRWEAIRFRLEVARLACALAVFRQEAGRYPLRLAELAPKYVTAVPKDVFSDKPLVYRRTARGYLLYSVGPNLRDDGGEDDVVSERDDIAARAPV